MNRDLLHEHDVVLDRPDPWGDIPDMDGVDNASDLVDSEASPTGATDQPPAVDEPPKKERRSWRDRFKRSGQPATKPLADPAAEVTADQLIEDLWSLPITPMETDDTSTELTDADLVPPPALAEPEPAEVAEPALAEPEPASASLASDPDHTAYIPPWPDRSLDVLPYTDRSSWPGVREPDDDAEAVPVLTPSRPPEPATHPGDADLEAYTLPAPLAAD